jgi:hypothetical protein
MVHNKLFLKVIRYRVLFVSIIFQEEKLMFKKNKDGPMRYRITLLSTKEKWDAKLKEVTEERNHVIIKQGTKYYKDPAYFDSADIDSYWAIVEIPKQIS